MKSILNLILFFVILVYFVFRMVNNYKIKKLLNIKVFAQDKKILDKTVLSDNKTISKKISNKVDKLIKGTILFEKYEVKRQIGFGSMGSVYLVRNIKLGNLWALKVINCNDFAGIFREEGILRKINYISIPKIVDVYYKGETVYIIEDYIEGISLAKAIKTYGNFSQEQIIKWGIELSEMLAYLHTMKPYPIIFRDLKPSNIIVTNYNKLVIIDFGISKYKMGNIIDYISSGTRKYAPNEQFSQDKITDEKTDIYSLGIVLAECVLGNVPTTDDDIKMLLKFVDVELVLIIIKMINLDREKRYDSAIDIISDLENLKDISLKKFKRKILFGIANVIVILLFLLLSWEGLLLFL